MTGLGKHIQLTIDGTKAPIAKKARTGSNLLKDHSLYTEIDFKKSLADNPNTGTAAKQEMTKQFIDKLTVGSGFKLWWSCDNDGVCECHKWVTTVNNRYQAGHGCPFCSHIARKSCLHTKDILLKHALYNEVDFDASLKQDNKMTVTAIQLLRLGSDKLLVWKCDNNGICDCHRWSSTIANRKAGSCPFCSVSGKSACSHSGNSLFRHALYNEIDLEASYQKDNRLTVDAIQLLRTGSSQSLIWKCHNNGLCDCHRWYAPIASRTAGRGCPFCSISGTKACFHTEKSLLKHQLYDEIDFEASFHKDSRMTVNAIQSLRTGSGHALVWKCDNNGICDCHRWSATIASRTTGNGCPFCASNSNINCKHSTALLKKTDLFKEVDVQKSVEQLDLTIAQINLLTINSIQNLYWTCTKNPCGCHNWRATPNSRSSNGRGCPYCCNAKLCAHNNFAVIHPEIAVYFDMEKNFPDRAENFSPQSGSVVWWICKQDLSRRFAARVCDRVKANCCSGCSVRSVLENNAVVVLDNMDLTFIREYRFKDSRFKYDFLIKNDEGDRWLLETDGRQHFSGYSFGGSGSLDEIIFKQIKSDKAKDKLACKNHVDLLRIPYTVKTIEEMQSYIEYFVESRGIERKKESVKWYSQFVNGKLYQERDDRYKRMLAEM